MKQTLVFEIRNIHHDTQLLVDLLLDLHVFIGRTAKTGEIDLFINTQVAQQFIASTIFILTLDDGSFPYFVIILPQTFTVLSYLRFFIARLPHGAFHLNRYFLIRFNALFVIKFQQMLIRTYSLILLIFPEVDYMIYFGNFKQRVLDHLFGIVFGVTSFCNLSKK